MTLILTSLCKDGICICADKRNQTFSGGGRTNVDNLNKIFRFKHAPIIMFNHGVNKFNNKFWYVFCKEYEQKDRWLGKNLKAIAMDFKNYIEPDLLWQLSENARNFPGIMDVISSAFVICGKDIQSNKFEFHELFWSPAFSLGSRNDKRLIGSGEGYKKYLENYVNQHPRISSTEFWGSINTVQARAELIKLFSIALDKQKSADGGEFSENFDIESVGREGRSSQ